MHFWEELGAHVPKGYDVDTVQGWITTARTANQKSRDQAKRRLMGGLPVAFWGYLHKSKPWEDPKYVDQYRTRLNDIVSSVNDVPLKNWLYPPTRMVRGEFRTHEEWGPHGLRLIYYFNSGADD